MSEFYKGDVNILYIKVNDEFIPIGCLTNNDFSQSYDVIETTTRDNQGWSTSQPTIRSYSINFEGIETLQDVIPSLVTHNDLEGYFINNTLLDYRIGELSGKQKTGQGYITNLSDASPAGDLVTFTGTIIGFGAYTNFNPSENRVFNYDLNFDLS